MSQIILRGKSPCVGRSPTVMMYFLWPWGPCQFYPAQLAQSSSPNSLGLLHLRRLRWGCAPQGNRGAYTCLRPHTQVPRLPLALGSKAGSLPRGLWPATQADETPTASYHVLSSGFQSPRGGRTLSRGRPATTGAAFLHSEEAMGRLGPSALRLRTLASPAREP